MDPPTPTTGRSRAACDDARSIPMSKIGFQHQRHMVMRDGTFVGIDDDASPLPPGHMPDALQSQYARKIGFSVNPADIIICDQYPSAAKAGRDARAAKGKVTAYPKVCDRVSTIECFALEMYPETPYAAYLMQCKNLEQVSVETTVDGVTTTAVRPLKFMKPPAAIVLSFIMIMREPRGATSPTAIEDSRFDIMGRGLKFNAIAALLSSIGTLATEAGCEDKVSIMKDPNVSKLLNLWEDSDELESANPFDIVTGIKKMYESCFNMSHWSMQTKIKNWAWVLFTICVIGRASCVSQYCPLIEDMMFPDELADYDKDNLPKYIAVGFRHWKGRPSKFDHKPYYIYLHRNYLDPRACPVFWLCMHLMYLDRVVGPIFCKPDGLPYKDSSSFRRMVQRIFNVSMMDCTPHSLRRTAFQWAGRCNGTLDKIKMVARHVMKSCYFVIYMQEGFEMTEKFDLRNEEDPVYSFWVWKPATPNRQPFAKDYAEGRTVS